MADAGSRDRNLAGRQHSSPAHLSGIGRASAQRTFSPPSRFAQWLPGVACLRLPRTLQLDVLVDNVTDENFYEKRGYNLQGRTVQVRLGSQL